jgi:hypothetical protein
MVVEVAKEGADGVVPASRLKAAPGCHVSTEWYPLPGSWQLRGRHVSPGLQHSPPSARQLWGRDVSPWLQLPPPGAGQFRGCHVSPRLPPLGSGQLRGRHVAPAPTSRLRTAPGRHVSPLLPTQGNSRGDTCPRGSGGG